MSVALPNPTMRGRKYADPASGTRPTRVHAARNDADDDATPHVARDRDPETSAGDDAVHRGDHRLAHLAEGRDERVIPAPQLIAQM
jgi:hypothetical protein